MQFSSFICRSTPPINHAMRSFSLSPSPAISACEKVNKSAVDAWIGILRDPLNLTHHILVSFFQGLNPTKALEIFDEMKREGVRPTVVTFSALISACEKGQQWKLALQVLEEMKATFGPNVIAYSGKLLQGPSSFLVPCESISCFVLTPPHPSPQLLFQLSRRVSSGRKPGSSSARLSNPARS